MDHARRDGRTPGVRGSRSVTEGCSAAFEGGELARSPKGCEPFASGQSVRGCTSAWVVERSLLRGNAQHAHKMARAVGANPLRSCFHGALPTARVPGVKNRTGVRDWQTQGDSRPRKGNGVSRRARRRSRGCARTLFVSFAEVDRRSWLREALSPIRSLSKEGRGTRWTGAWPTDVLNRSKSSPLFQAARLSERSSPLRSYAWRREP